LDLQPFKEIPTVVTQLSLTLISFALTLFLSLCFFYQQAVSGQTGNTEFVSSLKPIFDGSTPLVIGLSLSSLGSLLCILLRTTNRTREDRGAGSLKENLESQVQALTTEIADLKLSHLDTIKKLELSNVTEINRANEAEAATTSLREQLASAERSLQTTKASAQSGTIVDAEVVNLLALLQSKGRFIDFVMDDISSVHDAAIGAAARVVHQGCKLIIEQYLTVEPIHLGKEGQTVDFDQTPQSGMIRLTGSVNPDGKANRGRLLHKGWKVSNMRLPRLTTNMDLPAPSVTNPLIIAPAEIETV
jgi:hypothetical protein